VYFDDGEVTDCIDCQHTINGKGGIARESNDSDVASLDDVIVGYNDAIRANKETGASCYGFIVVRHHDRYDCSVRSLSYRRDVLSRRCRLHGCNTNAARCLQYVEIHILPHLDAAIWGKNVVQRIAIAGHAGC